MEKETRYVGVKETLSYGLANAGQVFGYNLIAGGYLSLFFTKVFEIPPAAVSTMILFLGIWDTVNDPLMGGIIDKTRTRYGKLRPYLLFLPLPLAITTIMLFAGPEILADAKSTTVKIIYMYVSYFIWELFYTLGDVPFWSMSAAISPSTSDRTRVISTARFLSGLIGGLSTTMLVVDFSNKGVWNITLAQDFLILACIAGVFGMGLFSLAGLKIRERVSQSVKEPSLLDNFKVLIKNKPLLLIIVANVLGSLGGVSNVSDLLLFGGTRPELCCFVDNSAGYSAWLYIIFADTKAERKNGQQAYSYDEYYFQRCFGHGSILLRPRIL